MNSLYRIIMDRKESLFNIGGVHVEVTPRGTIFVCVEDALLDAWGTDHYVRGLTGQAHKGYLYADWRHCWRHGSPLTGEYPVDNNLLEAIERYILEARS